MQIIQDVVSLITSVSFYQLRKGKESNGKQLYLIV